MKPTKNRYSTNDTYTVTAFLDAVNTDGIIAKMNKWYYWALGEDAFLEDGGIPYRLSTDEFFYRANARMFFHFALKNKKSEYLFHRWGAGTFLRPVKAFFEELEMLDEKEIVQKVKYVFSDYSEKIVDQALAAAEKDAYLEKFIKKGQLVFEVLDAMNPPKGKPIHSIESSYLYDSIPQTIVAKEYGNFYRILYRGTVDKSVDVPIYRTKGTTDIEKITSLELAEALRNEDWNIISRMTPQAFDAILIQTITAPINLREVSYGTILEDGLRDINNIKVVSGNSTLTSIEKAVKLLDKNGFIQIFDLNAVRFEDKILASSGEYHRFRGGFFAGVNFFLLQKYADQVNLKHTFEHCSDFLEHAFETPVLSLIAFAKELKDENIEAGIISSQNLINFNEIKKLNKDFIKKGYTAEGKDEFKKVLISEKLMKIDNFVWDELKKDQDQNNDYLEYLTEYLNWVVVHKLYKIVGGVNAKQIWLFGADQNTLFHNLLKHIGFDDEKVIKLLLEKRTEINKRLNYYLFTLYSK